MKLLLIILFSFCLTTVSLAQTKDQVKKYSISYIRHVPKFARRLTPAYSKSLFWGKFSLNPNLKLSPQIVRERKLHGNYKTIPQVTPKGFHLYSLYSPELARRHHVINCHLALDIFELKPKPKIINRVFLTIKRYWPPTLFGMSFAWMNAKSSIYMPSPKTMPLLIVRSFTKGAYTSGIESFISFHGGWNKQASVTHLQFGGWHASDTGGEVNTLIPGKNGIDEIDVSLSPTTSELTEEQYKKNYTFSLTWNSDREKYIPRSKNKKIIWRYFYRLQQ